MKSLRGMENNPIPLTQEDFETTIVHPFAKVYVYKNGWQLVPDVVSFDLDFEVGDTHNVVSAGLNLTVDDSERKYHPLSGTEYSDYFAVRRKIKVYVGIKKDVDGDGVPETPYTWPYFEGIIANANFEKLAGRRQVKIKALDYCSLLQGYRFDDMAYWGSSTTIYITENEFEYDLPSEATGVFRCRLEGADFNDWTYNFETGKIAITKGGVSGRLTVYYFTPQSLITVMRDILLASRAISSTSDFVYQDPGKIIQRVWFDKGTTAQEAIEKLSQLVPGYYFFFDGDGKAHFHSLSPEESVFTFSEGKNIESVEVVSSDRAFYNGVEVKGEERIRNEYYRKEIVLGTVSGSLDAFTISKEHNFEFTGTWKLRYELNVGNKNGISSELRETPQGARIVVTHNPEYSREETETYLGSIEGTLGVLENTEEKQILTHVAATRVRCVVDESVNRYGLTTSLERKDFWTTEVSVSHDPLRNLSGTVVTLGTVQSTASPGGNEITISFPSGKLFGSVKWKAEYETGWGAEFRSGSKTWNIAGLGSWIVQVNLSQDHLGQHRYEATVPADIPDATVLTTIASNAFTIPPYTEDYVTIEGGAGDYLDEQLTYQAAPGLEILGITTAYPINNPKQNIYIVYFKNPTNSSKNLYLTTKGKLRGVFFRLEPYDSSDSRVRFKITVTGRPSWTGTRTFSVNVYSRRMPHNTRVNQVYEDGTKAVFVATCDWGNPPVTITCTGQEAIPRRYKVLLYGLRLIPRDYYITLYGREQVPKLEQSVYTVRKLADDVILATGGPKFLSIRNHLIQSKEEADALAQQLLNRFSTLTSRYRIQVTCPPPIEAGDTIRCVGTY